MSEHKEVPVAKILRVIPPNRRGGSYRVRVQCPYCELPHEHGLGANRDSWGRRAAHCSTPGEYEIKDPATQIDEVLDEFKLA